MRLSIALTSLSMLLTTSCAVLFLGEERFVVGTEGDGGSGGGSGGTGGATGGASGGGASGGAGGSPFACTGDRVIWARRFGDASRERPLSIDTDGEGGVFVSGTFSGSLDLGGGPLKTAGGTDLFLARFDRDGNHLWSKSFGDAAEQTSGKVQRAPDGDVLLTGSFKGSVDFGDGARTAVVEDAFVARYSDHGEHRWTWTASGSSIESMACLAVDPRSGDLVLGGSFHTEIDLGGQNYVTLGGGDIVVVRLDASGGELWSRHYGGPADDSATALAIDEQGRIVFGGGINTGADLGLGPLTVPSTLHSDAYLGVYAPNGDPIWTKNWGDSETQVLRGLAIDPSSGNFVVAGRTDGVIDFGGGSVESSHGLFLAKLDGRGGHVVSDVIENIATEFGFAVDAQGNVVLGSDFNVPIDLGGGPLIPAGSGSGDPTPYDGVIVKLDPNLEHVWSLRIGGLATDSVRAVAVDEASNVFAAAYFGDVVSLDGCPEPLTSAGDSDLLLVKLAP